MTHDAETVELKPCPFCGSVDVMNRGHIHIASVVCRNCGASCGGVYPDRISGESLVAKAKRQWNTRAALSSIQPSVKDVTREWPSKQPDIEGLGECYQPRFLAEAMDVYFAGLRAISEGE